MSAVSWLHETTAPLNPTRNPFAAVIWCWHRDTFKPMCGRETCKDCGSFRLMRFTKTAVEYGRWQRGA